MSVWARMVLPLSWGALSGNQVARGNSYSTARDVRVNCRGVSKRSGLDLKG